MLILARHGNTFGPGETARIVGAHEDLPLTAEGREQARLLGAALHAAAIRLDDVIAGPLARTLDHARIAAAAAGFAGQIAVDPALRELDYGAWSGLTDQQVATRFGRDALDAWRRDGVRPRDSGWAPAEDGVRSALSGLAARARGTTLWVTSNGVLRYAMDLDPRAFAERGKDGGFRVGTGRICVLRRSDSGWNLVLWNEHPDAAALRGLALGQAVTQASRQPGASG